MPAYMVTMKNNSHGDILLEDPALALELTDAWATFTDDAGTCLAVPREYIGTIQRLDADPQDTAPEG